MKSDSGIIFDIKRFSINDGPGIRTTVFFKGCPLRCVWCHNPEGLSMEPQVYWDERRCLGSAFSAHECTVKCTKNALHRTASGWELDPKKCDFCKECERLCPTEALQIIGKKTGADDLMTAILKDRPFFDASGGGVTFSGGEPLMQHAFLGAMLRRCQTNGVRSAVDTCGFAAKEVVASIMEATDLFLYDIKIIDDRLHKKYTGVSNRRILDNLKMITAAGKEVIARIPLIPGITVTEQNIFAILDFLNGISGITNVSLLNFHKGGEQKYRRYRKEYGMENSEPLDDASVDEIKKLFEKSGYSVMVGE
ncbi:MAG: glycyl-radical enzyme activating protein [Chitinispirillaceae bacterium]|nr:glycyl-radical enzyme activating protein [Chitinispirillaceae bacterium]